MHPLGVELENDPEDNPCFGCGPRNPIGLRMRFFDDGEIVRSTLKLDERYCGSYGRVLEPIVYAAMDEMIVWASYARFRELAINVGDAPSVLRYHGRVATDETFFVEGFVVREARDHKLFRARVTQRGEVKAEMEWAMRRRTPAEIEAELARPKLSRSIREEYEKMLRTRS